MFQGARILVAPLDWGLGHSTRCIPVIRRLQEMGARPVIGADGGPLALLRDEFPTLPWVCIPGVNIRYGRGRSQLWSMARQFPAMVRSVQAERALFDRIRGEMQLDAVISDQRFGIRATGLPSVLITHQVFPFTPIAQGALRQLNLRHIARFDRCWVMDEPEAPGLAGELSHGARMPANARYIGTLSRLRADGPEPREAYRIVAVFSGPEPQRGILEQLLLDRLPHIPGEHLMVCGQPGDTPMRRHCNITLLPHLPAEELAMHLRAAELIVSRSGYTTLMDLVAMGRTALVIPTPGQAEQEYLGELHMRTGRFVVQDQGSIDLKRALDRIDGGLVSRPRFSQPLLDEALKELAASIGRPVAAA